MINNVTNTDKINFTPTNPEDRIAQIDILRGFALFGVLLVNSFGYNSSFFDFGGFYRAFDDPLNSTIFNLVIGFVADKFIFIFSFLFGMGFSMMYLKYGNNESQFFRLYLRRMLVLMLFGIIHITFFWAGDILLSYSLMGIIMLLLRKQSSKVLLTLSGFFYFFPIIYIAFQSKFPALPDALSSTANIKMQDVIAIYSKGSFSQIFSLRISEFLAFRNINLIYYAPKVLSLFLLGSLFFKHHFLDRINANIRNFSILAIFLFLTGLQLTIHIDDIVNMLANPDTNSFYMAVYMGVYEVTNIFLGFSYILTILILTQISVFSKILNPLKYIGRTALTNYLLQTIIFTTIMYSYGLGRFGSFQPWQLIIYTVIIFAVQIIISKVWLQFFRFGPFEWIWRKLTYFRNKL